LHKGQKESIIETCRAMSQCITHTGAKMKTFTVAGTSVLNGVKKMRFATNMDRVKVLLRNGHEDIELQALPHAMTKDEIRAFLGGAPVVAVVVAAAEPEVIEAGPDTVKWLEEGETPSWQEEEAKVTYETLEEALAAVPMREKGRFIKKEVREQMARDLMAA